MQKKHIQIKTVLYLNSIDGCNLAIDIISQYKLPLFKCDNRLLNQNFLGDIYSSSPADGSML